MTCITWSHQFSIILSELFKCNLESFWKQINPNQSIFIPRLSQFRRLPVLLTRQKYFEKHVDFTGISSGLEENVKNGTQTRPSDRCRLEILYRPSHKSLLGFGLCWGGHCRFIYLGNCLYFYLPVHKIQSHKTWCSTSQRACYRIFSSLL